MISILFIIAMVAGVGWFAWRRWTYWRTPITPQPSEDHSPKARAFEAFMHGNTCLAAGQWADATAAFEQARALDPKRPYVAERLAEVVRRQHAGIAPVPVAAGGSPHGHAPDARTPQRPPDRRVPPRGASNGWEALCRELAAARHAYDALLEPMHRADPADPELAAGFRRLRATTQQHRAGLLEMLVQSDPYALPRRRSR